MCDCPTAGVFTTHETRRSWIIYKETKTENGTTNMVQAGMQSTTDDGKEDLDLENMHLLLDEDLRPPPPDPTDSRSVAMFKEHNKLAQEYLKVQTEIVYQSQKRERLKAAECAEIQKQRQVIERLQSEKESLILLKESLTNQNQTLVRYNANQSRPTSGDWVILPSDHEES